MVVVCWSRVVLRWCGNRFTLPRASAALVRLLSASGPEKSIVGVKRSIQGLRAKRSATQLVTAAAMTTSPNFL